jgi:hypothetical protein
MQTQLHELQTQLHELWRIPFKLVLSGMKSEELLKVVANWNSSRPEFYLSAHRINSQLLQVNYILDNAWLLNRGIKKAECAKSEKVKEAVEDLAIALAEEFADACDHEVVETVFLQDGFEWRKGRCGKCGAERLDMKAPHAS